MKRIVWLKSLVERDEGATILYAIFDGSGTCRRNYVLRRGPCEYSFVSKGAVSSPVLTLFRKPVVVAFPSTAKVMDRVPYSCNKPQNFTPKRFYENWGQPKIPQIYAALA